MKLTHFENINLAEVLPRIPDINVLPFGVIKIDLKGKILEYNMAEGELTGTDSAWATGKNFFHEVAMCTKTPAFYGKFLEGVKSGFLNAVFNYSFDHRNISTRVRVHMMTMPDAQGQKIVVVLVTRINQPVQITEAFQVHSTKYGLVPKPVEAEPSVDDATARYIAKTVMSVVNPDDNDLAPAALFANSAPRFDDIVKF